MKEHIVHHSVDGIDTRLHGVSYVKQEESIDVVGVFHGSTGSMRPEYV
jgi:hypothetical protein